jgi:prepilin-type processing-associated H-X9-DG protein
LRTSANEFLKAHGGSIILTLKGTTILDEVNPVNAGNSRTRNEANHELDITLAVYEFDSEPTWVLVKKDDVDSSKSQNVCLIAAGNFRGTLGDARDGSPESKNWFKEYDREKALNRCVELRDAGLEDLIEPEYGKLHMAQRSEMYFRLEILVGCGKHGEYANSDLCKKAERWVSESKAKDEQNENETKKTGTGMCNSIDTVITQNREQGYRLVMEMVGRQYGHGQTARTESIYSIFLPINVEPEESKKDRIWFLYQTDVTGATYLFADGHTYSPNKYYFEKIFPEPTK